MTSPKPSIPREIVRYYEITLLGQYGWLVGDDGKKVHGHLYNGVFYQITDNDSTSKPSKRKKASKPTDTL